MKPDLVDAIAASNAAEVERAKEAVAKPSTLETVGDASVQLDNLGQIVDLGLVVVNGIRAAGDCIAAVCDAIPNID